MLKSILLVCAVSAGVEHVGAAASTGLVFSDHSKNLGRVYFGQVVKTSVTLTNVGDLPVLVRHASISCTDPNDFRISIVRHSGAEELLSLSRNDAKDVELAAGEVVTVASSVTVWTEYFELCSKKIPPPPSKQYRLTLITSLGDLGNPEVVVNYSPTPELIAHYPNGKKVCLDGFMGDSVTDGFDLLRPASLPGNVELVRCDDTVEMTIGPPATAGEWTRWHVDAKRRPGLRPDSYVAASANFRVAGDSGKEYRVTTEPFRVKPPIEKQGLQSEVLPFGVTAYGERVTKSFEIVNHCPEIPWQPGAVRVNPVSSKDEGLITVEVIELKPGARYRVSVTLDPKLKSRTFRCSVEIDSDHPYNDSMRPFVSFHCGGWRKP